MNHRTDQTNHVLMYLSRLLDHHTNYVDVQENALIFTIQVQHFYNTDHVQKAIYEKIHRALYGRLSSRDNFTFSMFIVSDVEETKFGYTTESALRSPATPHYHGIILFSQEDWDVVNQDLRYWKGRIKGSISHIRELKEDEVDEDGCVIKESIWIEPFDKTKWKQRNHHALLGDWLQYSTKAHFLADKRGIHSFEPKVFPFDAYATDQDADRANLLFKVLEKRQMEFEQEVDQCRQQQFINQKKPKREAIAWQ